MDFGSGDGCLEVQGRFCRRPTVVGAVLRWTVGVFGTAAAILGERRGPPGGAADING